MQCHAIERNVFLINPQRILEHSPKVQVFGLWGETREPWKKKPQRQQGNLTGQLTTLWLDNWLSHCTAVLYKKNCIYHITPRSNNPYLSCLVQTALPLRYITINAAALRYSGHHCCLSEPPWGPEGFLCGVCTFSSCLCGFRLVTPYGHFGARSELGTQVVTQCEGCLPLYVDPVMSWCTWSPTGGKRVADRSAVCSRQP